IAASGSTLGREDAAATFDDNGGSISYHAEYEGNEISCNLMTEFADAVESGVPNASVVTTDVRSGTILSKAQALADDVNMLSSPTANRGDTRQADVPGKLDSGTSCTDGTLSSSVGAGYNAVVDRYYTNYNHTCNPQYKSSPGYDSTVAALTDRNL